MTDSKSKFVFVCIILVTNANSLLTDVKSKSSKYVKNSGNTNSTDILRQLLNQETLIRMSFSKDVHTLMNEVMELKDKQKGADSKVTDLRKEIDSLKQQNTQADSKVTELKKEIDGLKQQNAQLKLELESQKVRVNTSVSNLRISLSRTEYEQAKISAGLTTLQQNYSAWLIGSTRKIHFSAAMTTSKSSYSSSETIIFPKIITNMGNAYNSNTGIFTSPTDGTFVFYFSVYVYGKKYHRIDIEVNGVAKASAYNPERTDSDFDESSSLVVLHLKTGDNVWLKYGMGNYGIFADVNVMPIFSGFII